MNMDDFEKRLQRQPMRQVPGEWRGEILAAATAPERWPAKVDSIPLWRLIFGQFPVASTAFAGFWIVLIAVNVLLFGVAGKQPISQSVAHNDEPSSIWQLQTAELQQLAGGDSSISAESPTPAPQKARQTPRSDWRRDDERAAEILPEHSSNFTA
jgi:hypothetical protein